jgi:hypothetical protein
MITLEQFEAAYNKHLPSGWIKFAYKYFSQKTEKKDMSVRTSMIYALLSVFLLGFLGTIFNAPKALIAGTTYTFSILLALLVLYIFSAVFLNNLRLKKIMKELGINKVEYNKLVDELYS